MNFNNFTIKSQEAVQQAIQLVQSRGQQVIEPEHLLAGVLKVGENVTNFIFQKLGMNGQQVAMVLDRQIASLPKVSGGEPYLSRGANEVLQKAVEYSKGLGDEYVSLEAMLLAILNVKGNASTILKDAGFDEGYAGENIGWGYETAADVCDAWKNSETHLKNILDPDFKKIGIGVAADPDPDGKLCWTQIFLG